MTGMTFLTFIGIDSKEYNEVEGFENILSLYIHPVLRKSRRELRSEDISTPAP
jgi:hypothetical protein